MNNLLNKYLTKVKNPKFLIILGAIGILLIFLSSFGSKPETQNIEKLPEISVEEYRDDLEKDIEKIVKSIKDKK